jgi:hypothetical protein
MKRSNNFIIEWNGEQKNFRLSVTGVVAVATVVAGIVAILLYRHL